MNTKLRRNSFCGRGIRRGRRALLAAAFALPLLLLPCVPFLHAPAAPAAPAAAVLPR